MVEVSLRQLSMSIGKLRVSSGIQWVRDSLLLIIVWKPP